MLWSRFICFTLLCAMCGEAASIKVSFWHLRLFFSFFYWHYTWNHFEIKLNDCLEWELLSLCCGVWPLIVIYRDGKEIAGRAGWGYWRCIDHFPLWWRCYKYCRTYIRDRRTVILWILLDKCLLCVVHWTILKVQIKDIMYGGIIAPGFECHISQARYNNTPPLASFSIYLLYRLFFCHYQDKCFVFDSVVFWLSVFAICFTENNVWLLILIINNEISNASYSEWCGQLFFFVFCFLV